MNKTKQPKTIRTKLLQMVCITIAVGMLIVILAVVPILNMTFQSNATQSLVQLGDAYSDAVYCSVRLTGGDDLAKYAEGLLTGFVEDSKYEASALLLDEDGALVAAVGAAESVSEDSAYKAMTTAMLAGESGSTSVRLSDGAKYLVAYCPVGNNQNWSLALFYSSISVLAANRFVTYIMVGLSLILIAIAYYVATKRAATLVVPIGVICDRLGALAEGDIHSQVSLERDKTELEVGELVDSLRKTVSRLNTYISDIGHVLSGLAEGDFTVQPEVEYAGDFSQIRSSLEAIKQGLSTSFKAIYDCADAVKSSSDVVSSTSQNLAQGATEQASAVEELAATVAGIAEQAAGTADRAGEVRALTKNNEQNINKSMSCMQELKSAMEDMALNSSQISKIVKTIDDLAFQTNILALNAAVEAARAGQQGKGFAVVADEVRNLANKSAEAAKETQRLVSEAIRSTENGTGITGRMNEALTLVTEKNAVIADKIDEIAADAESQNVGIEQVNTGIEQISIVVQSNTATAEESAAASAELNSQAQTLEETVSHFHF